MMKARPGHGIEDCEISFLEAFCVVSAEDAEGVGICHVSDPIKE